MNTFLKLFFTFIGLGTGNFIYMEWIADTQNYALAFDRTFFQGVVFITLWMQGWFTRRTDI